ncbi:MAG TPA: hypothetical protein VFR44_01690 [Actinomycetota bacterium]|nr:hypothetical protein [Actinomycetota bacterium]
MDLAEGSTGMEIRIRVHRMEPLGGTAAADAPARRLEFDGWMGLIGAIAELLGSADEDVKEAG